ISPALAALAAARAKEEQAPVRYQIRIERAEGGVAATADLPNALPGGGWYFDLPISGGRARAVLGLALPSGFHALLHSRWADVPPDGPCPEQGAWETNVAAAENTSIAPRHPAGYLSILLHAHLPFIRHPEYEDS